METAAKKQNIILQFLSFQFFDVPREILRGWKNFLLFNLNFFSIPLLIKTLFAYWRRYHWTKSRGFDIGESIEVALSNLISRVLGAIVRIFFIIFGLAAEAFIILSGIVVFLGWLVLPAFMVFGIFFGFKIYFK
jgi:small-conductance mechanosensitive channel